MFPFWPSDGTKQDRIRFFTGTQSAFWQWATMVINRNTTNIVLFTTETNAVFLLNRIQHFVGLCHHFRADTVAG
ncbi:Uncharacterised protein [Vibrio cholerae]|nr:Uncharacterised protein [Vibrio cholerae]CSC86609.1 Uncharacterised protein [Vibrio cholerae]CSD31423.1 Uncharacterised protein [Vibrio cholerae]CSI65812.1 Uncharacterised protein [Vibrio cholerae]